MRLLITFILVILLALTLLPSPEAQERPQGAEQKKECGTTVPREQIESEILREAQLAGTAKTAQQANGPYYIPLTVHIVRQSNGTGGFTLGQLAIAMRDLNRVWRPGGIQFFVSGAIDYINNDTFFTVPNVGENHDALRQVNVVANTINVYFTNLTGICGKASFTTGRVQGVLIDINCAGGGWNQPAFAHELGHYFDLYHTHETRFGVECPNGSNCGTAGDRVCDTTADPGLSGNVNTHCAYTGIARVPDGCGTVPYDPPTRNLMSYSDHDCMDRFTTGQLNRAVNVLVNTGNRSNLINSFAKYVNPNADPRNTTCTYRDPCNTVNAAIMAAREQDHIFVAPGLYALSPSRIIKSVVLEKWDVWPGAVEIR